MKLTNHAGILGGIALVLVLVLAFVIPFAHTSVFWIALIATVAMFGVCAFAFYRAFKKDETMESKLLGWPIFKVGYVAVIAQTFVGFTLMALATLCPVWAAVIAEAVVFAVVAFCMTVKDAARETVTASEAKVSDNTAAWKAVRAKAAAIAASTGNPDMKKLAEEIRFADPTPTEMDAKIADLVDALADYGSTENINKVMKLVQERKSIAKESKK